LPVDHLRAGHRQGPKAARSAVVAKRRALHGAEHRCTIVVVMAIAPAMIAREVRHEGRQVSIAFRTAYGMLSGKQDDGVHTGQDDSV
jgi:hypothetical protein